MSSDGVGSGCALKTQEEVLGERRDVHGSEDGLDTWELKTESFNYSCERDLIIWADRWPKMQT